MGYTFYANKGTEIKYMLANNLEMCTWKNNKFSKGRVVF